MQPWVEVCQSFKTTNSKFTVSFLLRNILAMYLLLLLCLYILKKAFKNCEVLGNEVIWNVVSTLKKSWIREAYKIHHSVLFFFGAKSVLSPLIPRSAKLVRRKRQRIAFSMSPADRDRFIRVDHKDPFIFFAVSSTSSFITFPIFRSFEIIARVWDSRILCRWLWTSILLTNWLQCLIKRVPLALFARSLQVPHNTGQSQKECNEKKSWKLHRNIKPLHYSCENVL